MHADRLATERLARVKLLATLSSRKAIRSNATTIILERARRIGQDKSTSSDQRYRLIPAFKAATEHSPATYFEIATHPAY